MRPIKLFQPADVMRAGEMGPVDLSPYKYRFIAEGDSWFSFGALFPPATGNLLEPLVLRDSACAINCASPGKELLHMVDSRRDLNFLNLMMGAVKMHWDGILLSGGGNDLIDAVGAPAIDVNGKPVEPARRLLLTPAERGKVKTPAGYVSEAGWTTFVNHLVPQFHEFVALRDDPRSASQGVPIFVHTYDFVTPRDAGAGFGFGPWLYPALLRYAVPPAAWDALSKLFLQRLSALVLGLNLPALHVAQTQGTCVPAADGSTGDSNDWENEIHPNPGGYAKLAAVYGAAIDAVMP